MLIRIKSKIFQEEMIKFHEGLNVVLGDNKGSNSIGKSTLLMIVDFVFGGNTYITHNKDMVDKLGDHDFLFTFKFNDTEYNFIRGTDAPEVVFESNGSYERLDDMKVGEFRNRLEELYKLDFKHITFRSAVSTFSRVWGKNNYDVKKPLHNFPNQGFKETVSNLIKTFQRYDEIAKQDKELKTLEKQKSVLNKAGNFKFIPKITKRKYEKNIKEIDRLNKEIEKVGHKAQSPSINVGEIVSDELIKIREEKNKLLDEREYFKSRLNRTNKTIKKSSDAGFENLVEFFPNVNLEKLNNIESFHNGIRSILSNELKSARQELRKRIGELDEEIKELNDKQDQLLNPDEELTVFIDKLIEYTSEIKNLQLENEYYHKLSVVKSDLTKKEEDLDEIKTKIITQIENDVNEKINEINDLVHGVKRTAPQLDLSYTSYEYKIFDNTGTGKAYSNLLIFDLAILRLTRMPFIIHDSFLFKNIEKDAVEQVIDYYDSMSKQVFIAIDLINMYNKQTQETLQKNKVIQLSEDKLLTTLDWRDSSN
ncbi:DUF2326 domain-containing protein [Pontibacillus yanchengensis]|uniref:DUF2326 domain-containing protein n=1 Tax=Pontibacillus yanchengensis Y32 TaxID=1385514 RepID=A0A0A2T7J6_9BACI|nr:DUF2326 domain-containing protein [Pontibacillus yanchengensis]KGP71499.1 hypothetical protein N782_18470 [Pontibacillus yanchengensis Y32]